MFAPFLVHNQIVCFTFVGAELTGIIGRAKLKVSNLCVVSSPLRDLMYDRVITSHFRLLWTPHVGRFPNTTCWYIAQPYHLEAPTVGHLSVLP